MTARRNLLDTIDPKGSIILQADELYSNQGMRENARHSVPEGQRAKYIADGLSEASVTAGYADIRTILTALSELQAREAVLIETHTEACDAADHLLAHVTAEVGRYLYDAPETNLVPMLAETNVTLTGAMWMRLYKATARTALSRTTPTQEA